MSRRISGPVLAVLVVLGAGVWLAGCDGAEGPQVATAATADAGAPSGPDGGAERGKEQMNACLREHGVDPEAGTDQLDPDRLNAAMQQCRQHLPAAEEPVRLSPEDIERNRRYAQCIREHGVPDYPDPDPVTGRSVLTQEQGARLKDNPRLTGAQETCRDLLAPADAAQPGMDLRGGE